MSPESRTGIGIIVTILLVFGVMVLIGFVAYDEGYDTGRCEAVGNRLVEVDGERRCVDPDLLEEL